MVSGVVPAPLSAHPLVIWDAPLFGRLMSSSNHVARHTKHIVIREISQDSKHPKNPATKIRTGSNANNIYSIIVSWNFGRALADNSEKLRNFAGRIDRVDWIGLITAAFLISIRHRGPKKVGSQRKAFYGFALSIRASPHDLYNGLYLERMRGRIGVTWTLRIYQLPSLAHLLYRHFVSSETFGNRPWPEKRAAIPCRNAHPSFLFFIIQNLIALIAVLIDFCTCLNPLKKKFY